MMNRQLSDEQLLAQCRVEAFRGPGPGGQKRNKTSSAIRLLHVQSGITANAAESRSQARNRQSALVRLRHKLAIYMRQNVDLSELPDAKLIEVAKRSLEYPAAMGKVLDVLDHAGWSVSEAAELLGISVGRLVAFLRADAQLFAEVNRQRKKKGFRGLNSS